MALTATIEHDEKGRYATISGDSRADFFSPEGPAEGGVKLTFGLTSMVQGAFFGDAAALIAVKVEELINRPRRVPLDGELPDGRIVTVDDHIGAEPPQLFVNVVAGQG